MLTDDLTYDDTTAVTYLILTEPTPEIPAGSPVPDEAMIANNIGEMLHRCKARGFETTGMYEDHSPTAELPLIAENDAALECVIEAIRNEKLEFKVETRWSSAVANEMRTKR